jgi:hypothetical protein
MFTKNMKTNRAIVIYSEVSSMAITSFVDFIITNGSVMGQSLKWRGIATARSCWTVFLCQLRPAHCQLRPKAFILHYACVKIHNIPNCYWQDPFKYDILRVTHKAGSFKAPGWYRKRADTGADRPCFCVFNRIATCILRKSENGGKTWKNRMLLASCRHDALFCRFVS